MPTTNRAAQGSSPCPAIFLHAPQVKAKEEKYGEEPKDKDKNKDKPAAPPADEGIGASFLNAATAGLNAATASVPGIGDKTPEEIEEERLMKLAWVLVSTI